MFKGQIGGATSSTVPPICTCEILGSSREGMLHWQATTQFSKASLSYFDSV